MATNWLRKPWLYLALSVVVFAVIVGLVAVHLEGNVASQVQSPSRQLLIGTWKSASGAVLRLNPDGTFASQGLSARAGESSTLNIPPSGTGRWHVGPVPEEPPGVVFAFARNVQMELLVERVGGPGHVLRQGRPGRRGQRSVPIHQGQRRRTRLTQRSRGLGDSGGPAAARAIFLVAGAPLVSRAAAHPFGPPVMY